MRAPAYLADSLAAGAREVFDGMPSPNDGQGGAAGHGVAIRRRPRLASHGILVPYRPPSAAAWPRHVGLSYRTPAGAEAPRRPRSKPGLHDAPAPALPPSRPAVPSQAAPSQASTATVYQLSALASPVSVWTGIKSA